MRNSSPESRDVAILAMAINTSDFFALRVGGNYHLHFNGAAVKRDCSRCINASEKFARLINAECTMASIVVCYIIRRRSGIFLPYNVYINTDIARIERK